MSTDRVITFAGSGVSGSDVNDGSTPTQAEFKALSGVAIDSQDNLYVVDQKNYRVFKIDKKGTTITTVAGTGKPGYSGDGGPATNATLSDPVDIAVDESDNLYISEWLSHRVRMVDNRTKNITTIAGNGQNPPGGYAVTDEDKAATQVPLCNPSGLAIRDNFLYIADTHHHCIRRVNLTTKTIQTIAGNGTKKSEGDGGLAKDAKLSEPTGLAFDKSGNLYISEWYGYRVRKIDIGTQKITTFAGNGKPPGVYKKEDEGNAATEAHINPHSLAIDNQGKYLYIADSTNHCIRRVNLTTKIIKTVAGQGRKSGYVIASGENARFNRPLGIVFDSTGTLYVADSGNWVVRAISEISDEPFDFDPADLIPLTQEYGQSALFVQLTGGAIKEKIEIKKIIFDTGSWTLSIPYGCLDKAKITTVARYKITDPGTLGGILGLSSFDVMFKYGKKLYQEFATEEALFSMLEAEPSESDLERNLTEEQKQKITLSQKQKKRIKEEFHIRDPWRKLAVKVKGELGMKSQDGKTTYLIDDYEFFALINEDGTDVSCDKIDQQQFGAIVGAFPSVDPKTGLKPLPYALAEKYSAEKKQGFGMGIVSKSGASYLLLGADPKIITDQICWRTDIPNWRSNKNINFCPEAVPGFTVRFEFPDLTGALKEIEAPSLMATIDIGAPQMVLRLNKNNPQNASDYSAYFTTQGFWRGWFGSPYHSDAKMLQGNCTVTVEFTDSSGTVSSYSFTPDKKANAVAVGTWDGEVPWPISDPEKPHTRFNLGNTILRIPVASVVFYDIENARVGILIEE